MVSATCPHKTGDSDSWFFSLKTDYKNKHSVEKKYRKSLRCGRDNVDKPDVKSHFTQVYGFAYIIFSILKSLVVESRVGGVYLGEGTAGGKRIRLQEDNRVPSGWWDFSLASLGQCPHSGWDVRFWSYKMVPQEETRSKSLWMGLCYLLQLDRKPQGSQNWKHDWNIFKADVRNLGGNPANKVGSSLTLRSCVFSKSGWEWWIECVLRHAHSCQQN